ncbi:MAG TPA: hypothetical protein VFA65_20845 [Bryobacteraceae bacterium]|nr:hypothetical protein [Bryobacteraceae bacterium]
MRFLVNVKAPVERLNKSIQDGSFPTKMQEILSELKPEAAYFLEEDGRRTAILIVDIAEVSQMTRVGEPFFLGMNAEVHFHPVMTPQDLANANLTELGKRWGGG